MSIMLNFFVAAMQLMRVERPIGTILLVYPMLWALWIAADGYPPATIVLIFLLGAFVMRSAGCVINDFADREIDKQVKRTKDRPLTAGRISRKATLGVFAGLIILALVLLCFLPTQAILPAVIAFLLATIYPFTKRFFIIPQLILGLAYSMAIFMAFMTLGVGLSLSAWLLFIANTLWAIIYDTFYAMVDSDDDIRLGIHSSALWFKSYDILINALLMLVFLLLMAVIGWVQHFGIYYYLGLLGAMGCFIYQLAITRHRQREACFRAFLNNQWVGVLIFTGILMSYLP